MEVPWTTSNKHSCNRRIGNMDSSDNWTIWYTSVCLSNRCLSIPHTQLMILLICYKRYEEIWTHEFKQCQSLSMVIGDKHIKNLFLVEAKFLDKCFPLGFQCINSFQNLKEMSIVGISADGLILNASIWLYKIMR